MSLSVNGITSGLLKIVRELIPQRLSTIAGPNNTTVPSVILARSKTPKPSFPYAVIDHIGIQKIGYADRASYFDSNDDEVTEFDYKIRCMVSVHAGTDEDSLGICEEFRSRLLTTQGRRSVLTHLINPFNTDILSTSEIIFLPSLDSTDFEEVSQITIDFWARSVIVDETTETIDSISLDGELYKDFDQSEPPLEVNVNVP